MCELLNGAYDLHVHVAPDVVARKCTGLQLAKRLLKAGMKGCAIKNHYVDTAAYAAMIREQFPQLDVVGGVTLNRSVGGINPHAVERSAQLGGRLVWFPTLEALEYRRFHQRNNPKAELDGMLSACGPDGELLPASHEVLAVAKQYNMTVGTGHIGSGEGMALVREAAKLGCRMVLTHADNPAGQYTVLQQQEAVALGAVVEHSFFTTYYDRTPIGSIAEQIRAVGYKNVILTTDFGQPSSPNSDEGMAQYIQLLLEKGFSEEELRHMTAILPGSLISQRHNI